MNKTEIDRMVKIVNHTLSSSLMSKNRAKENVDARIILSKILLDKGLNVNRTSMAIGKDHSTVVHYKKRFECYITTDKKFRLDYNKCITEINKGDNDVYSMSDSELISLNISLKEQINELYLELSEMQDKMSALKDDLESKGKHSELFSYIQKNTPKGKEKELFIKVRAVINGLY